MKYLQRSLILFFGLIILFSVARAQPSEAGHWTVFYKKIQDTLSLKMVRNIAIGRYTGQTRDDSLKVPKNDTDRYKNKPANKKRVQEFLAILKDSSNYLSSDIVRSCAFVPEYYFKFILKKKRPISVLFSASCSQLMIMDADFKRVVAFGDLNDKGISQIRPYLEK